jgi:hypothetical protein
MGPLRRRLIVAPYFGLLEPSDPATGDIRTGLGI